MSNEPEDDDDDSISVEDVAGQQPFTFIPGTRGPGRPPGPPNVIDPVTNEEPMPCFPNAAKKETRQAQSMDVEKLDPPYDGFKGTVPHTSTKDYIAGLYGDGIYKLTLKNGRGQAIRVAEGVKISIGIHPTQVGKLKDDAITSKISNPTSELGGLLNTLVAKLEKDDIRGDAHTSALLSQAREMAKQHADSVIQSSKDSSQREQEFHKSQMLAQEQMYKGFMTMFVENSRAMQERAANEHARTLAQQSNDHQRMIELMDRSHNQMMALTTRLNTQETALLRERLQFEIEHSGDNDNEAPWLQGLTKGIEGIKELRQLAEHAGKSSTPKRNIQDKVNNLRKLQISSTANKVEDVTPTTNQHRTTMRRINPQSNSENEITPSSDPES